MPEIEIRTAIATDIPYLTKINHTYTSEHVWQMELQSEENQIVVVFREVRLPRSVQVPYPRDVQRLPDEWTTRSVILVAIAESLPIGYIGLTENHSPRTLWVTDFAVKPQYRRQGVGTALLLAAQEWARQRGSRRIVLEMQPKNYATISLAQKMGFEFCGFNDRYFENLDIALFFEKWVR